MQEEKSEILGEGYGSDHSWKKIGTTQTNAVGHSRYTFYKCTKCYINFFHHYDTEPNIFEAMKCRTRLYQIPEHCNGQNQCEDYYKLSYAGVGLGEDK
jgi:hypothetical protein